MRMTTAAGGSAAACPACGQAADKIVYGLVAGPPGPNERLGGCLIAPDNPDYACPNCRTTWQVNPLRVLNQGTPGMERVAEMWDRLPRLRAGERLEATQRNSGQIVIAAVASGQLDVRAFNPDSPDGGLSRTFARHQMDDLRSAIAAIDEHSAVVALVLVDSLGRRHTVGEPEPGTTISEGIVDRFNIPLGLQVEQFLAHMMHLAPADLPRDKDGELYVHNDTTLVFVRIISNPVAVVVFSPAVVDVSPSPDLFMHLAALSGASPVHWRYQDHTITAEMVLLAQPFIGNHLDTALRIMLGDVTTAQPSLIDGYGGRLLLNPDTQHSSGSAAADEQGEQR